jgi:hypothetical protein
MIGFRVMDNFNRKLLVETLRKIEILNLYYSI